MHIPQRSTHAGKLERWLGHETVEQISASMKDWYGPPILVGNVPSVGGVYARRGGDFVGKLNGGGFMGLVENIIERAKVAEANRRARVERLWKERRLVEARAGFSSLSDLIAERTAGKGYEYFFQKVGTTGVVAVTNSLWRVGNQPAAAGAASNAPGGDALTDASAGAFPFTNPTGGDTQHFVNAEVTASVAANTLLLYDRLFQVNKTMSSTATEAVTGVPTRYQAGSGADYSAGNFLFVETQAALGATAHNWTTCLYTDQDGNTGATLPSLTGNNAGIINRLDHPASQWFAPLATGDTGIRALTQMQCSASVTGTIAFVIGHPLAFLPCPVANMVCITDGINTAFSLHRIFDDACLAFLEVTKPATTATTYSGRFQAVAG